MDDVNERGWRPGVWQLEVNLDDCPGQLVSRALEVALDAGALDVWATPVTMKKGRPGLVVGALAEAGRRDAVALALLAETTTLGVRAVPVERLELERTLVPIDTEYGSVRIKVGMLAGVPTGAHPEYADCLARAEEHGVAVKEVMSAALASYRAQRPLRPSLSRRA
jgi:pyridinium-3,5-bisthiocarboxylic acid mononucleotide nickel chelatase